MNDATLTRPDHILSFSIILETENLAINDPEKLIDCIQALENQSISYSLANEIFVVQSGDIPESLLDTLEEKFPWIQVVSAKDDIGYYEAKMEYVNAVTGEIVVFCDSDCVYVDDWLESLLAPFGTDAEVNVVTGETAVSINGPYTLAVSLSWLFTPYSGREEYYETSGYAANNVAFRRRFLLENPIPCDLDIVRGNCTMHARNILKQGQKIWKHPKAKAIHPYPIAKQYLLRFFIIGHNKLMCYRLNENLESKNRVFASLRDVYYAFMVILRQVAIPFSRLPAIVRARPRSIIFLPISAVIVFMATLGFAVGAIASVIFPSMKLKKIASKLEFD